MEISMSVKDTLALPPDIPCLLWTDRQVAAAIGMNVKRVQELARTGLLPGFKVGRKWRFDQEAIRSWARSDGTSEQDSRRTNAPRVKKHG
jgi:excisionase family DNA binding protein